ncbi:MAG: hypothetical protein AAF685_09810 [Cyanobacteria bacterium P01_C01_bin.89]
MTSTSSAIAPPALTIQPVGSDDDLQQFLDVPQKIYGGDPNWVPPLRSDVAKQLGADGAFRAYGKLQGFIAKRGDALVGRIVASVNQRLVEREESAIGLFGYFECIDDEAVATGLFEAAAEWLRSQGMMRIRGPIDLSTHNNCQMLIDGFEEPPMVMMPYNPPHYPTLWESYGFTKAKDAYAYRFEPHDMAEQFEKAYKIATKSGVTFRPIATKGEDFERDVRSLYRLFTETFANNWSSTPRTEDEFFEEAKSLQSLVDPDLFPIAEIDGEMVGFFMALPDYNEVLKRVNGKLDFIGILKFLWFRRSIERVRVLAFAALPEHRRKLIPLAMVHLAFQGGTKKNKRYTWAELGWVYEDNMSSRKIVEKAGGKIYKSYRIYEKSL